MSYVTIEDRVDRLEAVFGQFLSEMAVINHRAEERNRLAELRHQAAEERNKAAEARLARFEQEMREFKNEMRLFKDEMRASKRELDKKWGDLANKLGTILEDIVAPNLRRLAREYFQIEPLEDLMVRRSRRCPSRPQVVTEFDALLVGTEAVILGEAKSSPSLEAAESFAAKVEVFFDFFPEYRGRRLISVFGSWAIADPVVERLTQHRIYALRMGEDTMELANAAQLEAGSGDQKLSDTA
jgi:hypothetical protein